MKITPTDPVPPHGSVVLRHGLQGTAYQRHRHDGFFRSTSRATAMQYAELFVAGDKPVDVYLIYVPKESSS